MRDELLDLETIRRELYFTFKEMGEQLMLRCDSPRLTKIQPTRVYEWERGVRPVPLHVIAAYAKVATECWLVRREQAGASGALEVDLHYSSLINPSFAHLLFARERLRMTVQDAVALKAVEDGLSELFYHYRRLLGVDLSFCLDSPSRQQKTTRIGRPSRRSPKGVPLRQMF